MVGAGCVVRGAVFVSRSPIISLSLGRAHRKLVAGGEGGYPNPCHSLSPITPRQLLGGAMTYRSGVLF